MTTFVNNNTTYTLHPQWITGFTDAEGCFSVIIRITEPSKWKVQTSFEINLHVKDVNILHHIKSFFGVGYVSIRPNTTRCVYRVTKNEELLDVIIPHFSKYPLVSKKKGDFILWSKVVNMKETKKHLTFEGFSTILTYYAAINRGVSSKVAKYYSNIKAVNKPNIKLPLTLDPNWVSGFVAGDGGFAINIRTNKDNISKDRVDFRFHVAQHSKDFDLLNLFVNFFNSGNVYLRSNLSTPRCDFVIQVKKDIITNVIPHFEKYPLKNVKQLDYNDFKRALLIVESKEYLTSEGKKDLKEIVTGMNTGRDYLK
jgi:hypothetical protein